MSVDNVDISQDTSISQSTQSDQVFWPMLPGESLNDLAKRFYPDSPILRQRFIHQSLHLSREYGLQISVNEPLKSPQILVIPNEKLVREVTHRIKRVTDIQPEENLKLSYQLKQPPVKLVAVKSFVVKPPVATPKPSAEHQKLALPHIQLPEITLPTSKEMAQSFNQMRAKGIVTMKNINRQALQLVDEYKTKRFNQVMNDYRLRNIVLISALIVLSVVIWLLQKAHMRKKVKLLGMIEDTIQEDVQFEIHIPEKPVDALPASTEVYESTTVYEQKGYH
ncbi:MAG: hypothetical protein SFU55_11970 [Methylophilus sp.]|nr:hypothetical protein [Methylophilus sp.]